MMSSFVTDDILLGNSYRQLVLVGVRSDILPEVLGLNYEGYYFIIWIGFVSSMDYWFLLGFEC